MATQTPTTTTYRIFEDGTVWHCEEFAECDAELALQDRDFITVTEIDGEEKHPAVVQYIQDQYDILWDVY